MQFRIAHRRGCILNNQAVNSQVYLQTVILWDWKITITFVHFWNFDCKALGSQDTNIHCLHLFWPPLCGFTCISKVFTIFLKSHFEMLSLAPWWLRTGTKINMEFSCGIKLKVKVPENHYELLRNIPLDRHWDSYASVLFLKPFQFRLLLPDGAITFCTINSPFHSLRGNVQLFEWYYVITLATKWLL